MAVETSRRTIERFYAVIEEQGRRIAVMAERLARNEDPQGQPVKLRATPSIR